MADDSFTPRTLIQGLMKANPDKLDQTVRVTRRQAQALNASGTQSSATRPTRKRSASESGSASKKSNRSRLSASVAEATPRTLITGFLSQQDSEKTVRIERRVTRSSPTPSPSRRRRSRRASLLKEATTRRMRRSVSGVAEEPTPRTMIRGFLQDGDEQTPVVALRRLRESSIHQAYVSSDIEVSPEKSMAKAHKSVSEDSFMEAYLQQGSQPTTRQRKEPGVRSTVSVGDFVTSVSEKLSQSNRSRYMTNSQLENISEEGEGRLSEIPNRILGTIRVAADVHHDPMSSDKEMQDEADGDLPEIDHSLDISADSATSHEREASPAHHKSRRHTSERTEAGSPRGLRDSRNDSSRSPRKFNKTAERPGEVSRAGTVSPRVLRDSHNVSGRSPRKFNHTAERLGEVSRAGVEDESQDETLGIERRAVASSRGVVASAVRESYRKEAGTGEEVGSQEEEDRESHEGQEEGQEGPEELDREVEQEGGTEGQEVEVGQGQEEEELEELQEPLEKDADISSHGIVPGSESDDTDSPEGLPGFNSTFTANTTGRSLRQTTLDGYSTIQTPVLPPTQPRSQVHTPDIPVAASQNIRLGPSKQATPQNKASQARQPLGRVLPKKQPAKKKLLHPRLPKGNTTSIFKHFTTERISKDVMAEIENVADQFWQNVAGDLEVYADHAGRVTIDESDVKLLMDRQHVTSEHQSMYALVEKYLPLEYQQEIIDVVKSGNEIVPK